MNQVHNSNFVFLNPHDAQLVRLGMLAERYFPEDPNTAMLKLRQFAELLAQLVSAHAGGYVTPDIETQHELIRRLVGNRIVPSEIGMLFGRVRQVGNAANHALANDYRDALDALKTSWQLGVWFHRTFADLSFRPGPFIPPVAPCDESQELREELERLARGLREHQSVNQEIVQKLGSAEALLAQVEDEKIFWQQMAADAEEAKVETDRRLSEYQSRETFGPSDPQTAMIEAASAAAEVIELDETQWPTRRLVQSVGMACFINCFENFHSEYVGLTSRQETKAAMIERGGAGTDNSAASKASVGVGLFDKGLVMNALMVIVNSRNTAPELRACAMELLRNRGSSGSAVPGSSVRKLEPTRRPQDGQMQSDERTKVIKRIRGWAGKPDLKVHRILALVVRSQVALPRLQLAKDIEKETGSSNGLGAIASLLSSENNCYGRALIDINGAIELHPDVREEILSHSW